MNYENEELMDDLELEEDFDNFQNEEEEEELDFIDLSEFTPVKSKSKAKESTEAGIMSIINSKKNGKRITLSKHLIQKLKVDKAINIALSSNAIVIASADAEIGNEFPFKVSGNKVIIYSADLVNEITMHYGLDFSDCVSKTFYEVTYNKTSTHTVARISVK